MPVAVRLILSLLAFAPAARASDSVCYGSTAQGRIADAVALPHAGANFVSYGNLPEMAGRTFVHSRVRAAVIEAYRALQTSLPGKVFKYGETGNREGGPFPPHRTHQNGLSVDFFVPVVDTEGKSVHLPTHPLNRYGYDIEFDRTGRWNNTTIDYEALAAHLVALHRAARSQGIGIKQVIFDPELLPRLRATTQGAYLRRHLYIPDKPSWVRHDEHYHVDFEVPCAAASP